MDNLSVHKTKIVREFFDDKFIQMFLPPQSCELNPIEKVWNKPLNVLTAPIMVIETPLELGNSILIQSFSQTLDEDYQMLKVVSSM